VDFGISFDPEMFSQGVIGVMGWSRTFIKEAEVSIGAVFRKTPSEDSIRDKCLFDFQHPRQKEAHSVSLRSSLGITCLYNRMNIVEVDFPEIIHQVIVFIDEVEIGAGNFRHRQLVISHG
jgi:hypothetical protein